MEHSSPILFQCPLRCTRKEVKCSLADEVPIWKERVDFIQGYPTDPKVKQMVQALMDKYQPKVVMVTEVRIGAGARGVARSALWAAEDREDRRHRRKAAHDSHRRESNLFFFSPSYV
jgi:hypothetical protein